MKIIKLLCVFLMAALCLSTGAATKKTSKKKNKKNAAPVEVVDTICVDSFSYVFGKANSNGLKKFLAQQMGIDTTYIADFLILNAPMDNVKTIESDLQYKILTYGLC